MNRRGSLHEEFRRWFTPLTFISGGCLLLLLTWRLWPAQSEPLRESGIASASTIPSIQEYASASRAVAISTQPIQPLTLPKNLDPNKVILGSQLFGDRRLSKDNSIACITCHDLATAGIDGRRHSLGIHGREGHRNAPTIFNASLNYKQFWDGRVASLEEQVDGPVRETGEMGSNWEQVVKKLREDPTYIATFTALYNDGIQPANVKDAIATFERSLVTPGSSFDRYLQGEQDAISPGAKRGFRLFTSYGCISCHQGNNIGGNMMQPFGVMVNPKAIRNHALRKDHRLIPFTVIDNEAAVAPASDLFKVPSLRNVARTAPYFDDGSVASLPDAIRIMAMSQLGRALSDQEVGDLTELLESFTGRYQGKQL